MTPMSGKGSSRRPRYAPLADLNATRERTFGTDLRVEQSSGGVLLSRECYDDVKQHLARLPESQWIAPSPGSPDAET